MSQRDGLTKALEPRPAAGGTRGAAPIAVTDSDGTPLGQSAPRPRTDPSNGSGKTPDRGPGQCGGPSGPAPARVTAAAGPARCHVAWRAPSPSRGEPVRLCGAQSEALGNLNTDDSIGGSGPGPTAAGEPAKWRQSPSGREPAPAAAGGHTDLMPPSFGFGPVLGPPAEAGGPMMPVAAAATARNGGSASAESDLGSGGPKENRGFMKMQAAIHWTNLPQHAARDEQTSIGPTKRRTSPWM